MSEPQTPLYIRIANSLKSDIETEYYQSGDLLPTEEDLEKKFKASRITIRNALSILKNEGLVLRKQGKGTIVQGPRTIQKLNYISSITETFEQKGKRVQTGNLSIEIMQAPPQVISALTLNDRDEVYRIQRTRIIDKVPIAFICNYLLKRVIPRFEEKIEMLHDIQLHREGYKESNSCLNKETSRNPFHIGF